MELSTFVAAPAWHKAAGGRGAEVIKVETEKGDPFRRFGVTFGVPASEEENPLNDMLNGGKRCISWTSKSRKACGFCTAFWRGRISL